MKQKSRRYSQGIVLAVMVILFFLGIVVAARTSEWAHQAIYSEHDKHLSNLASTVDHSIDVVLDRCRTELSDLVNTESFCDIENKFLRDDDRATLVRMLKKNPVLLTDYADRIVIFHDGKAVLSTQEDDRLDYTIADDADTNDVRLCIDNSDGTSRIALSCLSENSNYVYYVLIDLDSFFRRVVVDEIYNDYWILLYDKGNGLILQNVDNLPEHRIIAPDSILKRRDGYSILYEHEQADETGATEFSITDSNGDRKPVRMFVLPTALSENKVFTVALAIYNENIFIPMRKITFNSILAAALIAFSAATAAFFLLHSGKREQELANEIASLEKQKQLSDEIIKKQEQLAHHQKLETIGTLTAGIAHEFNNLLSPIMGNSMLILEKSRTTDQEIFDNALEIYEASDRAKELVQRISKLSRKQSASQMNPVLPEKLITDVLSMSAYSFGHNINVEKVIETDSLFLGDENQLSHMLLNLVINAVQAMKPEGGTLTVAARSDGSNVLISVSDTGKGIPEEALKSIFDPFFTTKAPGKGTGLGLSIAQQTATDHNGSITAENLPEGGAKFTFTVPVYKP